MSTPIPMTTEKPCGFHRAKRALNGIRWIGLSVIGAIVAIIAVDLATPSWHGTVNGVDLAVALTHVAWVILGMYLFGTWVLAVSQDASFCPTCLDGFEMKTTLVIYDDNGQSKSIDLTLTPQERETFEALEPEERDAWCQLIMSQKLAAAAEKDE